MGEVMQSSSILPLEIDNISYVAGGVRLIKDLSLTLSAGTSTIILGPNGAGKSLLLRLCHGLLQPNDGTLTWQGPEAATAGRYQAMVFQRPVMLRRSVTANLHFALKSRAVSKLERDKKVDDILEITGLTRLAKTPARALSTGEQQRLAIARAWSLNPEVLFLDEPTANLDPAATHAIEELIDSIKKSGTKIVMSTHDLGQARRLADNVLFLYRGRLLENAKAEQFFEKPENDLAQAFLKGELLWWHRRELKPPSEFKHPEKP
jgi:tungstate transport system ATP-binding protein